MTNDRINAFSDGVIAILITIMVLELKRAIAIHQAFAVLIGFHVRSELLGQWSPQSFDPLRIARLARPSVKGVLHRRQKKRYRINESSVKIEKNGVRARFSHTAKLNAPAAT